MGNVRSHFKLSTATQADSSPALSATPFEANVTSANGKQQSVTCTAANFFKDKLRQNSGAVDGSATSPSATEASAATAAQQPKSFAQRLRRTASYRTRSFRRFIPSLAQFAPATTNTASTASSKLLAGESSNTTKTEAMQQPKPSEQVLSTALQAQTDEQLVARQEHQSSEIQQHQSTIDEQAIAGEQQATPSSSFDDRPKPSDTEAEEMQVAPEHVEPEKQAECCTPAGVEPVIERAVAQAVHAEPAPESEAAIVEVSQKMTQEQSASVEQPAQEAETVVNSDTVVESSPSLEPELVTAEVSVVEAEAEADAVEAEENVVTAEVNAVEVEVSAAGAEATAVTAEAEVDAIGVEANTVKEEAAVNAEAVNVAADEENVAVPNAEPSAEIEQGQALPADGETVVEQSANVQEAAQEAKADEGTSVVASESDKADEGVAPTAQTEQNEVSVAEEPKMAPATSEALVEDEPKLEENEPKLEENEPKLEENEPKIAKTKVEEETNAQIEKVATVDETQFEPVNIIEAKEPLADQNGNDSVGVKVIDQQQDCCSLPAKEDCLQQLTTETPIETSP